MPRKTTVVKEGNVETLEVVDGVAEESVTVVDETAETEPATEEEAEVQTEETEEVEETPKKQRKPRKKPTDTVTVKVVFGSVNFLDQGSFQVGETFTCSREQAESIDQKFVEIIE